FSIRSCKGAAKLPRDGLPGRLRPDNNGAVARPEASSERRAGDSTARTYCVGIITREGLVIASDSRTNASYDQVNVCRKMHTFIEPGERLFVLLTSGSLSCAQSVLTLLRRDFDQGQGLASAASLYDAARVV